jgi:ABC-2 type transport system permease protein
MKAHRVLALLLKYFYITKNRLDRIFDLFYWPLIDLFVWGFATYFIADISNVNVLSMFLGGVILWLFVWRSTQDIAVYVLEQFWNRDLYHLYTTPIKPSEHMAAVIIFGMARALVSFTLLFALAFLIYSFNIFQFGLFLPLFAGALMLVGWVMGLFVTSLIFRFGHRIQVLAWSIVWGVQPFSCVFYPLSSLPAWAQKIAVVFPTTHIFESMRAVVQGNPVNWGSVAYAFAVTIILLFGVSFMLARAIKHGKKTGLIAKCE